MLTMHMKFLLKSFTVRQYCTILFLINVSDSIVICSIIVQRAAIIFNRSKNYFRWLRILHFSGIFMLRTATDETILIFGLLSNMAAVSIILNEESIGDLAIYNIIFVRIEFEVCQVRRREKWRAKFCVLRKHSSIMHCLFYSNCCCDLDDKRCGKQVSFFARDRRDGKYRLAEYQISLIRQGTRSHTC